jgi:hypothetical protein
VYCYKSNVQCLLNHVMGPNFIFVSMMLHFLGKPEVSDS